MNDDKKEKSNKKPRKISFFDALKKKEIDKDEIDDLEKGDFLAMMIAIASYMIPLAIIVVLFFVLLSWIFVN